MLSYHFDLLMLKKLFENISPPKFYAFSCIIIPWSFAASLLLIFYGIYQGLFVVPPDYQQGEAFRIIYVHVPSAWLSLLAYSVLFVTSIISLIWKIKVFEVITISSAKIGALFTFLALVTGSIWGKPMWGTWWVWDARLTSELILFFVYLSIIGISCVGYFSKKINNSTILKSSLLFFIISNFGVWLVGYPNSFAGFLACFTMALPFFVNTILGDFFFYYALNFSFSKIENRFLASVS